MSEKSNNTSASIRDNVAEARSQLKQGIKLTDEQSLWLLKTIDLQLTLIDAADTFIEALEVDNLRKSIEIHELKETVAHNG